MSVRHIRIDLVAVGVLLFSLGACGGSSSSDGPTKAETAAQANRLCRAANAKVAKDPIDITTDSPAVFVAGNQTRSKIVRPMLQKMLAITPARADRSQWRAFIAAQRDAITAMDSLRVFVRTRPTGGGDQTRADFLGHVHSIWSVGDAVGRIGFAYGVPECEIGPYIRTLIKPTGQPNPGLTKNYTSRMVRVAFDYPKAWHEKEVNGTSRTTAVAFGDDTNNCAVIVDRRRAPGHGASDSAAATRYARGQVALGRDAADDYTLISVASTSAVNVEGAAIVRRWTTDGVERAGRIAFFFANGQRYTVDCITSDAADFDSIDADHFQPFVSTLRLLES